MEILTSLRNFWMTTLTKFFVVFVMTISFLTSCSSGLKKVSFPADADPQIEIQNLEADLQQAEMDQTHLLSPKYFRQASKHLEKAKKQSESRHSAKDILQTVAEGKAALEEALRLQPGIQSYLEDILVVRQNAIVAGAETDQPKKLKSVDEDFQNISAAYEREARKGKTTIAAVSENRRNSLKESYSQLELESLKNRYLGRTKAMIEYAEKNKAAVFVPKTLESARNKYKDAELILTHNRTNSELIMSSAREAHVEAEKLIRVNQTARKAQGLTSEDIAIDIENKKQALEEAQTNVETQADLIARKNEQLAGALIQNQELRRKEEFDEALAQAQKMFKPEEADVYRQGDQILIRLKSAQFVSGRAEVTPDSYPVLKKVNELVDQVGAAQVVIEGHTDSTGSRKANLKLSKQRAEAVAAYLKSNSNLEKDQILTEGFGFEKPLAPNTTQKGRAQNRRVDIIVTPSTLQ